MEKFQLKGSRFSITRESDGAGDSGMLFRSLKWPEDKTKQYTIDDLERVGETGEIIVGCCMYCGSPYARTMQSQDWWLTSEVSEILETGEDEKGSWARVKTGNSIYLARGF